MVDLRPGPGEELVAPEEVGQVAGHGGERVGGAVAEDCLEDGFHAGVGEFDAYAGELVAHPCFLSVLVGSGHCGWPDTTIQVLGPQEGRKGI